MFRAFLVLSSLAFLFASAPAAPVPKHLMKDAPLYFPTTVGAKWVYDPNVTFEVTKVEEKDGGKLVTVTGSYFGPVVWHVSPSGLSIVSMGTHVCDPPLPMLRLPVADNKMWMRPEKGGALKGLFTAHGPEDVEVKAGKFRAIRVELEWVGANKCTVWYAPGIGEVKTINGGRKELTAFTPGK